MGRFGGYGYIPDLPGRGRRFAARAPTLSDSFMPEEFDLSTALPPRLMQYSEGSCCPHSVVTALRYNWINNGLPDVELSRNQLYYDTRKIEGTTASDAGCQISNAVHVAQTIGVAYEGLWPYDLTKWMDAPPPEIYTDAAKHEATELWAVNVDPLAIKTALYTGHPVIIGISVYPSFESDQTATTGFVQMPGSAESVMSGHSMLVWGGYSYGARARNWWGTDWGLGGDCVIPWSYFTDEYASDLWVISMSKEP